MDLLTQLMIFAAVIVALFVIAFIWEIVRRAYYWTAGKVMGWSEDEKLLRETAWLDRESARITRQQQKDAEAGSADRRRMGAFLVAAAVTWLAIRSGFVWWEVAVVFVCAYLGSHMVGGVALKWSLSSMRRLPAPWTIEALNGGFKVIDSNGQSLAYVYGHADQRDAQVA